MFRLFFELTIKQKIRPNSSPVTANIKSVFASGIFSFKTIHERSNIKIVEVCPIMLAIGGFSILAYPIIQKLSATNVPKPELIIIFHKSFP